MKRDGVVTTMHDCSSLTDINASTKCGLIHHHVKVLLEACLQGWI